jgi:hypothetical protein
MSTELIALLVAIATGIFVPAGAAIGKLLATAVSQQTLRLASTKWEQIDIIINSSVMYSQQQYKMSLTADRKATAMEFAKAQLKKRGLLNVVSDDILDPLIEAKVCEVKNDIKSTPPVTEEPPSTPPVNWPVAVRTDEVTTGKE